MTQRKLRPDRPRRYDIHPAEGYEHPDVALAVAILCELSERLYDLIADLPQGAMDYAPEGTTNSIAMLVRHMAWAEASWVAHITGCAIPPALEECLLTGRQDASGELPASSASAEQLMGWCREVRASFTCPALAAVTEVDALVGDGARPTTVRGVLMHLVWHWTYHSGQVGLLRRAWGGNRYRWTFDRQIGAPR